MDKKRFKPIIEHSRNKVELARSIAKILDQDYDLDLGSVVTQSGDWTEKLRDRVPENLCLLPFRHMTLDPDGRARPCCKYKVGDGSWQQNVPKLPDVNIEELWHQEEFIQLRDQFLRNERPNGCRACWDEETAGIPSMRLTHESAGREHPFATFFYHVPRLSPSTLDLKLSNLCNLKCRICTPFLSSQWVKEIKDLNVIDMGDISSFNTNSREKFTARKDNIEILKTWAPKINWLEFYGGEPLMQQEHETILRIIYEHGVPANTSLYYNTNGTICKRDFFELWSKFKEVIINFSIDDIGQRFEYQRKNADWSEVVNNLKQYRSYSDELGVNIVLKIYTTVGILNVYYLQEFFEAIKNTGLKVVLNMVHYPNHYSITNLPHAVKDQIRDKLRSMQVTEQLDPQGPDIDNIISFMYNTQIDPEQLKKFFNKTHLHDQYRKENFKTVFPELAELLNPYVT